VDLLVVGEGELENGLLGGGEGGGCCRHGAVVPVSVRSLMLLN